MAFDNKEEGKRYAKARGSRLKAEKKAAAELVTMTHLETQQLSKKITVAPLPEAAQKRTHFGNAEINKMMKGNPPESRAQSVENMNRRIAALG